MRYRWPLAASLLFAIAAPARAQSGDGYLFGAPAGSLTIRGGFAQARAGSDLFQDFEQRFTLSRGDFGGLSGGLEAAARVTDRLDLTLDVGLMQSTAASHYRGYVDANNNEIEQTTSLRRIPVTANARLYLSPRGREIGRFAWIPTTLSPWVGAGVGFMPWRLRQAGDYIDFVSNPANPPVYGDTFQADGTTAVGQGMVGADYTISPRLAITGDARYIWATAKRESLGRDFVGYAPLDLSGVALSLGLTVRL